MIALSPEALLAYAGLYFVAGLAVGFAAGMLFAACHRWYERRFDAKTKMDDAGQF